MATALTRVDLRSFDGTGGGIGHGNADEALAQLVDNGLEAINNVISGTDVILSGQTTVVVAVGTAFNGKPVVATLNEVDGVVHVVAAVVAAGDLTITLSAVTTADRDVGFVIDGRA